MNVSIDRLKSRSTFLHLLPALLLWWSGCLGAFGISRAEVITSFTGPFASDRWTLANGATFFGTEFLLVGVSSFGPNPAAAEVSVTVPTAGTLALNTEVTITPSFTGLGFGGAAVLIDGETAPWNGVSVSWPLRANQRLTFRVTSQDQPIPFHPGSYGGGPSVSLRLGGLVFTPADTSLPPIPATGTATVVNGFVVGVAVTEAGRGYERRPGVRLLGGGGTGARAVVELFGDKVSGVRITNPGSGYRTEPQVLIDPPGGRISGTVAAWGSDLYGECSGPRGLMNIARVWAGNGLSITLAEDGGYRVWIDPAVINPGFMSRTRLNLAGVAAVAAGDEFGITLWQGSFEAWGKVPDVPALETWFAEKPTAALSVGNRHALVLAADGTVSARGEGPAAVVPPNLPAITAIAAGAFHSLALTADGSVMAWGENGAGQTAVPAGLSEVLAIAAGQAHSLALTREGAVIGWGAPPAATVPPNLGRARAIAAGRSHSVALLEDGRVIAWGDNSFGQCDVPVNLGRATVIAAGGDHTLALTEPMPGVSIRAAIRLDFSWIAGRTYQLESSADLSLWTAAGTPEVADGDIASKVVDAGASAVFFRLRELP